MANASRSTTSPGATAQRPAFPTGRSGAANGDAHGEADGELNAPRHGGARAAALAGRLSERLESGVAALPRLASRARTRASAALPRPRRTSLDVGGGENGDGGRTDWGRLGVFGAGLAIGALLGAGTALLLAPATGFETRVRLARGARRAGDRVVDRWEDLGDAVVQRARQGKRRLSRQVTQSRWAAQDAWERRVADGRRAATARGPR